MVSCFVKTRSSAILRFHSVTFPWMSTPKIGAFAVSMSWERSSATHCWSLVISWIAVMPCLTPITPVTSPSRPRRVVAFRRISLRCPHFVKRGTRSWPLPCP